MASSNTDILAALTESFEDAKQAGEFDPDLDAFMQDTVVPTWRDNSPGDTGNYKDLVQVTQRAEQGRGQVGATADYSNIVEYGSEDTEEFAPMRRTVEQINNGQAR